MQLTRHAVVGAIGTAVIGAVIGSAASLTLSSATLGAARIPVPGCSSAGVMVISALTAGSVSSVLVSGLPPSCGNASIQVTVSNGIGTGSGSATVPAAGGAVNVTIAPNPGFLAATRTEIVVLGP